MGSHTLIKSMLGANPVDRVLAVMGGDRAREQGYMPDEKRPKKVRSYGATVYPSKH